MAGDAAKRFRELVAAGHEIPYDVQESGSGSPLPQYVPLTERFIRDHTGALTELDWGRTVRAVRINGIETPWCHGDIIEVVTGARDALDVLIVPRWFSNIELDWDLPPSARFLTRLGSFARLIQFDRRGAGMSGVDCAAPPTTS